MLSSTAASARTPGPGVWTWAALAAEGSAHPPGGEPGPARPEPEGGGRAGERAAQGPELLPFLPATAGRARQAQSRLPSDFQSQMGFSSLLPIPTSGSGPIAAPHPHPHPPKRPEPCIHLGPGGARPSGDRKASSGCKRPLFGRQG